MRKKILIILISLVALIGLFYIFIQVSLPDVEPLVNTNPETTALMDQRMDEAAESGKKLRIRQRWVSFKQIPKLLKRTVRISEDANFYFHEGIDLEELEESIKKNWQKGEFARGFAATSKKSILKHR